jgi:probable F420-dependent oxidoreductase
LSASGLTVRVGIGWNPFDRDAVGTPRFFRTVELLEELGYDSLWLSDTATRAGAAPLPALAAAAMRTEKLKLGTSVLVVPSRPPALLAKELATVDVISNGRLLPAFGIGVDVPSELAALGVDSRERVARLEEAVAIVRELWRGEPVTYRGRFTSLENVTLSPPPTRQALELWLSGSSEPALRRTGRIADGWLGSFVGPEALAEQVAAIRAAAAEAGRTIDEDHYGAVVWAVPTEADVDRLMQALPPTPGRDRTRPHDIIGVGPDGVRAMLERFRRAGATKFVLVPVHDDVDGFLRLLKEEAVDPVEAAR